MILVFIRALAVYEREPDAVTATEDDLLRDGFGEQSLLFVPDCRAGRRPRRVSPSTSLTTPPGWAGPASISKTLFVLPEFRGLGIGKALLQRVAAIALEKGCPRLQMGSAGLEYARLSTFTAPWAPRFMDEWRNVRVSGEALRRLAAASPDSIGASACTGARRPDGREGLLVKIRVIGGGLAGPEAALTAARFGCEVDLYEMRRWSMGSRA